MRRGAHALVTLVVAVASLAIGSAPATAATYFATSVDAVFSPAPGQLRVYGWAYDSDSPDPSIAIHVYVGGSGAGTAGSIGYPFVADLPRADVGIHPHGFDTTLSVPLDGPQPVYVYAINVPGSPGANELIWQGTVTIADVPPETTFTSTPPAQTTNPTVSFAFTANEASAFQCRLDQEDWQACTSPTARTLAAGSHTFSVRATSSTGTPDPTPATYDFTVLTPPPPPTPTPPPVADPVPIKVALKAVRKRSRLRIDVGPDLAEVDYEVVIQRKSGRRWRTAVRTMTRGGRDVVVVQLARGSYRVVVPAQHGMTGASAKARLKR